MGVLQVNAELRPLDLQLVDLVLLLIDDQRILLEAVGLCRRGRGGVLEAFCAASPGAVINHTLPTPLAAGGGIGKLVRQRILLDEREVIVVFLRPRQFLRQLTR